MLASVLPFAAGVAFAIVTEPALSARSSKGRFAQGLRDDCAAGSIFSTNSRAAVILISGIVAGGLPSIVGLAFFGRDFAATCIRAFLSGTPLHQIAAATGPHGVLEVPSLMLAGAAGMAGVPLLWSFASGNRHTLSDTIVASSGLAVVSLALLLPAAVIECHSTPVILRWTL